MPFDPQILGMAIALLGGITLFFRDERKRRLEPVPCCECSAPIAGERPHGMCGCNANGVRLESGLYRCTACEDVAVAERLEAEDREFERGPPHMRALMGFHSLRDPRSSKCILW